MPRPVGRVPEENGKRRQFNPDDTPYTAPILAEQVRQLYAIAPIGIAASFINSLIVYFVTRDVVAYPVIVVWLAGVWGIGAVQTALIARFRSVPLDPQTAQRWKRRFLTSIVFAGVAWGGLGLFPLAGMSVAHQVFLAFVLGGMAAGASSAFSVVKTGYPAFSIPALVPIFFHFLLLADVIHYAMAAMVFLFGGLVWLISLHNFSLNRTSLRLRFENLAMIDGLKAAKERAEALNAQLAGEIDAKLHAEAELRQYQEHLERVVEERTTDLRMANRELEQFAYVASHDLKAPLRAIASLAQVIEDDATGELDKENRHRLKLLRERAERMDDLIEGMLAYARLGRPSVGTNTAVALADVLDELRAELTLPEGFVVECEAPLPKLDADPVHLRQIFQNLVTNAVEHHDRVTGHVWVRARDAGRYWHLEVADDGPGIPEPERQQVFRMFATGSKEGHTGIGLAVVRKLVSGYGGEVEALANQPRGTVIRLRWPKRP